MRVLAFTTIFFLALAGCSDSLLDSGGGLADRSRSSDGGTNKLRHEQLVGSTSVAGKGASGEAAHVFIGLQQYESMA